MWGAIVGGLASLGKQWLSNRQKVSEAKAERAIERVRTDGTIAENLTKGLKDEAWTLTFIVPIWVGMYATLAGDQEMLDRLAQLPAILTEWIPAWAWALGVVVSVVVSFGGRATDVMDRMQWGKRGS